MTAHVDNVPCICGKPECQIPYGLCHCGCGEKSPIATQTAKASLAKKGKPTRYISGHGTKLNATSMVGTCVCGKDDCTIPFSICHCGCGEKTSLAKYSARSYNIIKGMPREYVQYHHGNKNLRFQSLDVQYRDPKSYRPINFEVTANDLKRFWVKVDKTPGYGPKGECWIWTASLLKCGYGSFGMHPFYSSLLAHRMSWFIEYRSLPADKMILHHCDNRACVRPDHLFLGTTLDNMQDCRRKGRCGSNGLRGETSPKAKLTEAQVREIRIRYENGGISCDDLGAEYGVSGANIGAIIGRRTWKHI